MRVTGIFGTTFRFRDGKGRRFVVCKDLYTNFVGTEYEWFGGLYLDEKGKISLPADNLLAVIIEGARKRKEGKNAQAGVFETQAFYKLNHDGSNDPSKLKGNKRFCHFVSVRNQQNRVMRARPIFWNWSLDVSVEVNPEVINPTAVTQALVTAGEVVGLCDYRPRFGRFLVEQI